LLRRLAAIGPVHVGDDEPPAAIVQQREHELAAGRVCGLFGVLADDVGEVVAVGVFESAQV